ncbi:MAG: helix-turn-helix transcriptional regulator [Furfurilactobacillus sp.]|jgi:AraC-like DNA-binding protein|uniref:Helix-turn-helix transcriptional regulator n=1 Tax=Furfurilactobacillus milii TaxID=2888272 RepID=A0ABT6D783_9LACO|nr:MULTISPECIES: helix-turn-helix transcriptional regulator [Furfurilactobacillus]QLE66576.1 DNA-binding response regulator AraC [Furfurilactobacillus rossiae]MCF6160028.1 helix-turn-helix transcriptional regulator [Furfurilactobacillus milii]MCF6162423.1 helix-turn-helix transcriptional regulator [Furfurilactobacillus milii]MCF6419943.1 helix-turn-helix transcriptional regulator [Furfurilactobacillus milii]MCH4010718.1 helix-turn-helix transcriptional regulator [Furfurilactobacillus sp.]
MNQKQTAQVLANFYVLTHLAVSKIAGKSRWISAGNVRWHELREDQFETLNRIIDDQTQLIYFAGDHGEQYLWCQRSKDNGILIGPFINSTNDGRKLKRVTGEEMNQSPSLAEQFDYFSRTYNGLLPTVISQAQLIASVELLLTALFDQKTVNTLIHQLTSELRLPQPKVDAIVKDASSSQSNRASYQAETALYNTIRAGQDDQVIVAFQRFSNSGKPGLVAPGNQLRNEKDLAIAATTLATRSAIQGGLYADSAYGISDQTIQMIEAQTRTNDVVGILMTQMTRFAKEVRLAKQHHYSKDINALTAEIYAHRDTGIQLTTLAAQQHKSAKYLASRFRSETGRTFMNYQNQFRLTFAQEQLTTTSASITDIAAMMNFEDASYFTKWFKRLCGQTPRQYRQQH